MFNQMLQMLMKNNAPLMGLFNQLTQNKTPRQQVQALIKRAQAQGYDIHAKRFSADDIRRLGL